MEKVENLKIVFNALKKTTRCHSKTRPRAGLDAPKNVPGNTPQRAPRFSYPFGDVLGWIVRFSVCRQGETWKYVCVNGGEK